MLAAISCFAAVAVLVWQSFREHPAEKLYVNRVAAMAELEEEDEDVEYVYEEVTEEKTEE